MTNSITKERSTGTIKIKVGEWRYITSEAFCASLKDEILIWKSIDPNIVQVNPNSGLLYACDVGTATVFATDIEETEIKVFCSIEVEATESYLKEQKATARSAVTMSWDCCDNGYGDISAMGYSGTIFEYKIIGSRVTLQKGLGAKNGTSNIYSDLFRSALVQMDNIYASMTPDQRRAWLKLRVNDFIQLVGIFNPQSVSETAKNIAKQILSNYGIDLGGMLEATILGVYNWYLAEEDAVSYYNAF